MPELIQIDNVANVSFRFCWWLAVPLLMIDHKNMYQVLDLGKHMLQFLDQSTSLCLVQMNPVNCIVNLPSSFMRLSRLCVYP